MKIAIFSDTYFPQVNGVAQTLRRLSNHLDKKQITYQVYSPENKSSTTYPNINQFPSLPFFLYPECRTVITNPKKIENNLKQFKPDLIHLATPYMMGLYGLFAAKKLNIPVVSSYHTNFDQYLKYYHASLLEPFLWKYLKWFHQSTEKIFVPSKETQKKLESLNFSDLKVWGRGIDSDLFKPNTDAKEQIKKKFHIREKYILLFVGRLAPEKDLDTLNKIVDKLPSNIKDSVHWLIVGDGPSKEMWEEKEKKQNNMTLTGYIKGDELARIYAGADLFVFPSYTETFGNVVLEAMACGTPAIVANEGGVKDFVIDNVNGRICEKRNAESFIVAISELLGNEKMRLGMGREARGYALTQSWNSIFDGLLSDYYEVIQSSQKLNKKYA
ncbi:glycosyltransferase family 4 protein [Niallia sp. FSL W8-0635]|uniref:glycosyltransferase family 4 protein n=1 Tax=Niallia sp. FSL W8-0635 TaxID=2975337 RepID=UPI0030F5497F